jgi:hypothetical protein
VDSRDANGWSAMHYCAFLGGDERHAIMKSLLKHGAELDARTTRRTPLHLASQKKLASSKCRHLGLLIRQGAALDARDDKVRAPHFGGYA